MLIDPDSYHQICPLEYIHDADKKITLAVRLAVGSVLSGPLSSSCGLLSTFFKCNAEDMERVSHVKAWHRLESCGKNKQADGRSSANQRPHYFLE